MGTRHHVIPTEGDPVAAEKPPFWPRNAPRS